MMDRRILQWCMVAILTGTPGCGRMFAQPVPTSFSLHDIQRADVQSDGPMPLAKRLTLTVDQTAQVLGWLRWARRVRTPKGFCLPFSGEGSDLELQLSGGQTVDIGHVWICQVVSRTAGGTAEGTLSDTYVRVEPSKGGMAVLVAPRLAKFLVQEQQHFFSLASLG